MAKAPETRSRMRAPGVAAALLLAVWAAGCSPRAYVLQNVADAVSSGGEGFATDDDPELVRDSVPFALKAMESVLSERPEHRGLLTSLARGFTQYAAAFVWQDAVEASDPEVSLAGRVRARRLYLRAMGYGMRGLSVGRPGFREEFAADPAKAIAALQAGDVPLLFWTGVSWSLAISTAQDDPEMLADLPRCEALMRRALELREGFDGGAIHEYFIAFEGGRPEAMGGSAARARSHFARAMELSRGEKVSPLVTLAETVAVRAQDRKEFLGLLDRALAFDARGKAPQYRLANLVAQRKARWLKGRVDELFLE
ncbi:MAG: TRAP transporter TatT component family protein [Deltaproteobacteria bacterium]|nr:TRAP transporter TatT component family protein [Candidatus Deferrimicrobiaceae bacterium]